MGVGSWYPQGQARLARAASRFGFPLAQATQYPAGCPTHEEHPYAFKAVAMTRAIGLADHLLWLDSSCDVQHPLEPIFDIIRDQGYFLLANDGWNNAQWCNDRSLAAFGYTRDQAEKQTHLTSMCCGFSMTHPIGRELLTRWIGNVSLYRGGWFNPKGVESKDPRCLGHRHDQSVLSLLAAQMQLRSIPMGPTPEGHFLEYGDRIPGVTILAHPC